MEKADSVTQTNGFRRPREGAWGDPMHFSCFLQATTYNLSLTKLRFLSNSPKIWLICLKDFTACT